ncbi:helix-turn-helix transcriptional regulator [uncultured Prevotella sp.]|uniref:helix-turn-helix domain-containing protein n=1 Tax=uncultured Prevotella sp. TaxID=159272 RepID=UPI0027E32CCD|nr:helix-turn-helix transcriptional regulator [uncultured Prevotella sp.]
MTRIKEILNERNISLKEFARMLGISYTALYLQINKPSFPTLEKWSSVLGVPMWQLFASPAEVNTPQENNSDFAAFIRYKGIHYTADTLEEFLKQVEEIKTIAR